MQVCSECKNRIVNKEFFVYQATESYFCSHKCLMEFAKKEKEKEDKLHLWGTLCRIFHVITLSPRMLGEIKRFRDKEGLSYKQIDAIVHYMYDVEHIVPYGDTIYKVPQYIETARKWYQDNAARKSAIVNIPTTGRIVKPNYEQSQRKKLIVNPDEI